VVSVCDTSWLLCIRVFGSVDFGVRLGSVGGVDKAVFAGGADTREVRVVVIWWEGVWRFGVFSFVIDGLVGVVIAGVVLGLWS
jgi:hypothetical protein